MAASNTNWYFIQNLKEMLSGYTDRRHREIGRHRQTKRKTTDREADGQTLILFNALCFLPIKRIPQILQLET